MTLRSAVFTVGLLALVWGVGMWVTGVAPVVLDLYIIGGAVVLLVAPFLLGRRYRSAEDEKGALPGGRWEATGEVFHDPESGKTVSVEYNPDSGRRRYIEKP